MLYIVATPLGNLQDITYRAIETLQACHIILCEDTRHTQKLLNTYGIKKELWAYHEHNAPEMRPKILQKLQENASIALLSDAGTPLISDPGYKIIAQCQQNHLPYTSLPGPCAIINALVLSGLSPHRFIFGGFPPRSLEQKTLFFQKYALFEETFIFYESPHRLKSSLRMAQQFFGSRTISLCREMTKKFEDIQTGSYETLLAHVLSKPSLKGEYVVLFQGNVQENPSDSQELQKITPLIHALLPHTPTKKICTLLKPLVSLSQQQMYHHILSLKN